MSETKVIDCPIITCPWALDPDSDAESYKRNEVFGPGVFESAGFKDRVRHVESQLVQHFGTHSLAEWAAEVAVLRARVAETEDLVAPYVDEKHQGGSWVDVLIHRDAERRRLREQVEAYETWTRKMFDKLDLVNSSGLDLSNPHGAAHYRDLIQWAVSMLKQADSGGKA